MMPLHELAGVIYVRKSTASDGKSTRDQESECRNWCATNKIRVEKVFRDEGKGASRHSRGQRDAWSDLKAYLRPGHILVAWEASRFTRDPAEGAALLNLCEGMNIPLAYSGRILDPSTGDDRFMGGLDSLLAARESDIISERVSRGIRGAVAAGTPHAHAPWGYRSLPRKPGTPAQWEIDPVEGPRVQEAVRRVLEGESRKVVLQSMKSTGYAPATATSFGRLLTNPALAGKRVHKGEVAGKGSWEPLITDEQHRQLVNQSMAMTTTPGPESRHLCSGIARCGKCGKGLRYRGAYQGGARQKRNALYSCPNGCCGRMQALMDDQVEKAVLRRLRNMDPNGRHSDNPAAAEAQKRITDLENDLHQWKKKALDEEVDAEMYAAVRKDRLAKIAALRPRTVVTPVNLLTPEGWPDGTMAEKRNTVRALLNITVYPMGRGKASATDISIKPT